MDRFVPNCSINLQNANYRWKFIKLSRDAKDHKFSKIMFRMHCLGTNLPQKCKSISNLTNQ